MSGTAAGSQGLLTLPRLRTAEAEARNSCAAALRGRVWNGGGAAVSLCLGDERHAPRKRWPLLLSLSWQGHGFQVGLAGAPFVEGLEGRLRPWGAEEGPEFLLRAALAGLMEERGLAALRLREIKRGAMCGGDGGVAVPLRLVCEDEEVSRGVWYGGVDFPFGGCAAALMSRAGVSPPDIWVGLELNAGAAELRINEFTDLDEGDVIFVEG